jgi:hypothetical protein
MALPMSWVIAKPTAPPTARPINRPTSQKRPELAREERLFAIFFSWHRVPGALSIVYARMVPIVGNRQIVDNVQ